MKKQLKFAPVILIALAVVGFAAWFLGRSNIAVLNPQGLIAHQQRDLIIIGTALSLLVVVPDWDHNRKLEFLWWAIPFAIILVLSVITWKSSHELDPYKALESTKKPVTIQVVALQWKWLFIYPEQNIASVNYVQFPEGTPVNFEITSDAPMNSFWIPQLGGQVYAMAGMKTRLHLMADKTGSYNGSSANLSGAGFSGMRFVAESTSGADFDQWVKLVKQSPKPLNQAEYDQLAQPSQNHPVAAYSPPAVGLYDEIVMKYMMPAPPASSPPTHAHDEVMP